MSKALKEKGSKLYSDGVDRPWLAADIDSYGSQYNRVRLHVLQGTPPRAFVLENLANGFEFAILIDANGKVIARRKDRYR